MVRTLNNLGKRLNVDSFYVSFFLSPLVSDAIEILVAYQLARKKTQQHLTVALAQIQGSVVLNNTLCLGLFLFLISIHPSLTWHYTSETVAILLMEGVILCVSWLRVQRLWVAWGVLCCHPLSVFLILTLKRGIGLN